MTHHGKIPRHKHTVGDTAWRHARQWFIIAEKSSTLCHAGACGRSNCDAAAMADLPGRIAGFASRRILPCAA